MTTFEFELGARVPDGWISVDPQVVGENGASHVLLRRADLDLPFTTNITTSEQVVLDGDRLPAFGSRYRAGLRPSTGHLEVVREQLLSESAPQQYAQELRFTMVLDGRPVEVMQTQALIAVPTVGGGAALLQILFSAQSAVYPVARADALEFISSINAEGVREPRSGSHVERAARGAGQGAAGGGGRRHGGLPGV